MVFKSKDCLRNFNFSQAHFLIGWEKGTNISNTFFILNKSPCRTKLTVCRCILCSPNVKFKIGICQMNLLSQYTPINLPPPPPPVYSSPRPVYTSAAPSAIYKSSSRSKRDPTPVPIVIEAKGLFTLYRVYVSCLLLTIFCLLLSFKVWVQLVGKKLNTRFKSLELGQMLVA